jgi:WD repeat-containing protein 23
LVKTIDARDVGWSIIDIDHSPDRRWVAYSSWSDYVFLCNAFGSHELHEGLHFGTSGGMCKFGIKFSPDSREILAGCSQGYFILYDIERKTQVCITDGHSDDINSVCYVSDNPNLFATASDDTYCCVWDKRVQADDGCVGHFGGHLLGLTCVATKGDERYLLTNGKDQMMKLWDMRNLAAGRPTVRQHGGFGFDYRYQRFSSQGRRLRSDTSLLTFSGHHIQRTLIRCNFSPVACSGQRFVYSGCASGRVVVYDILIGEMVHTIHSHNSIVRDVSWHPTFPSIATASV